MNIGDKVRLLHGKEEGIIRRIINNRLVEIEIEDGFLIPVLKNEIVSIASEERNNLKSDHEFVMEKYEVSVDNGPVHNEGLFLALQVRDNILNGWIINNTKTTILFSVHNQRTKETPGISHGVLNGFSYAKVEDWSLSHISDLPLLIIDIIYFSTTNEAYIQPVSKKIDIKFNMIDREKQEIPLLKTKGVLISLSEEQVEIDPDTLKHAMFTEEVKTDIKNSTHKNRIEEIDLHIEALRDDISGLNDDEILQIQLSHFDETLERAVISGLDQITFIHGIGSGTLRNKIHKKLSQYPHIKYFEDAMKEKFGYGATKVHLK